MNLAIYEIKTGRINRFSSCHSCAVDIQVRPGEEFFLNCPAEATHIIDGEAVTIAPPAPTIEQLTAGIREERKLRLTFCDWTQMPDSPLAPDKREEWRLYRQKLRDFPSSCDPANPEWPPLPV